MTKDPRIFLDHIRESIALIEEYTKDISREQFLNSPQIQDAVMRRLEIIGEAVKNLPADFKIKHPDTPWKKIAGLRDVLIHEYFGVDVKLLWNLIEKDLPVFKQQISGL
jgi:uncharacterized protein with HEPN domain